MTIANQTNRTSVVGTNAVGQEIPFSFPITSTSDIEVRTRVIATGVPANLTETTNYTVSINEDSGGTVTMVTAVATTSQIHVRRKTPRTQSLNLVAGGSFNAENIEDAFDKTTKLTIENYDQITNKAITFPETDPSLTTELPSAIDRASKNLTFDSDGNVAASASVEEGSVSFTTFGTNMAEAANALAAKAVINLDHALDVRDYGAVGDGSTDDSSKFQDAIDACPTGGVVFIPATTTSYRVANLIIKKPMTFIGAGWGSKLRAVAGETGYIIKVDGTEAGAVTRTSQGIDGGSNTLCIRIRNLYLEGNARGASIGGLYIYNADWGLYKDLWIFNFAREAINCYGGLRESAFDNINTRWCGNGSTYPNIRIKDMDMAYDTLTNNLYFSKLWSIYSLGDHIQIDTANGKVQNVRSITFEQCMFHGIGTVNDGAGSNPFDMTFSAAEKAFKIFDILSGDDISILNSFFIAAGLEVPCINIESGTKDDPARIRIIDNRFSGRYDSSATANDIGIHLQDGSLILSGNAISGTGGSSITYKTETGTALYLGANLVNGGDPSIAGGVYYGETGAAAMDWLDTNFKNLKGLTIGANVLASAHYADVSLADTGVLNMKETTTPTATPGYGKFYTKADNRDYFQNGAGVEHEVALVENIMTVNNAIVCVGNEIVTI